jgi:hypothetical protein
MCPPFAVVGWKGGALIVSSQIANMGWAMSGAGEYDPSTPGTTLRLVAPDGTVTRPRLGLAPRFVAWGASSDGTTLSLVGTYALSGDAGPVSRDVVVVRGNEAGAFETSALVRWTGPASLRTQVREQGRVAIAWPPPVRDDGTAVADAPTTGGDEPGWKGNASGLFVIGDGKTTRLAFRSVSEGDCSVADAAFADGLVYYVLRCPNGAETALFRFDHDGARQKLVLPALAKGDAGYATTGGGPPHLPCRPRKLVARPPDDLWVVSDCGPDAAPVPAVFRRGRSQEPIALP